MTKTKLILVLICGVSFFCHDAIGQVSRKPSTGNPNSASAPIKQFNHTEKISTSYDRFENTSLIFLSLTLKELKGLDQTTLSVSYFYDGKILPRKVGQISLSITRFFGDFGDYDRFRNPSTLIFLLDSRRLGIPMETTRELDRRTFGYDNAKTQINYSQFLRLTNAKNVEGRLADVEFSLTDTQLEALQDFANRLSPQNQK